MFERARISVLQISDDYIPDFEPPQLDRALVAIQRVMPVLRRELDDVRALLDWPPGQLGCGTGQPSDVALAAILLHPDSPYGLLFEWEPEVVPAWPNGRQIVLWRSVVYDRDRKRSGMLTRWPDSEPVS